MIGCLFKGHERSILPIAPFVVSLVSASSCFAGASGGPADIPEFLRKYKFEGFGPKKSTPGYAEKNIPMSGRGGFTPRGKAALLLCAYVLVVYKLLV